MVSESRHRNIGGAISGHSSMVPYQDYQGHLRPFIGQKAVLPYYRKLTLHEIKALEINAT